MHLDSLSHAYIYICIQLSIRRVPTGGSPDSRPQQSACHISFLGTFSFHFKCITFQTFPLCATPCDAKPWSEHTVPAQDTFQPLNSISSLPTACVSPLIICPPQERNLVMKYRCGTKPLDSSAFPHSFSSYISLICSIDSYL